MLLSSLLVSSPVKCVCVCVCVSQCVFVCVHCVCYGLQKVSWYSLLESVRGGGQTRLSGAKGKRWHVIVPAWMSSRANSTIDSNDERWTTWGLYTWVLDDVCASFFLKNSKLWFLFRAQQTHTHTITHTHNHTHVYIYITKFPNKCQDHLRQHRMFA